MNESDQIIINGLKVSTHIGVPDEERKTSQEICLNLVLYPREGISSLEDDIEKTVDYYAVSLRLQEVAEEKPRKLIETLAEEMAWMVLNEFSVVKVTLEIEKFILSNARYVGVKITRTA